MRYLPYLLYALAAFFGSWCILNGSKVPAVIVLCAAWLVAGINYATYQLVKRHRLDKFK